MGVLKLLNKVKYANNFTKKNKGHFLQESLLGVDLI